MTKHKDLKRLVRARMQKTGESYTSARAVIIARNKKSATGGDNDSAAPAAAGATANNQWAALAGMSDKAVKAKTGRTWPEWVEALDKLGAREMPHRDIAIMVHERFGVGDWWCQTVTVGYERIRGLREVGQRRDGSYEASRSRTFSVPLARLYEMFSSAVRRRKWLPEGVSKVRTSIANRSMRVEWRDGTHASFWFVAKGAEKCSVAVQHTKLKTKADIAARKAFWAERFEALSDALK